MACILIAGDNETSAALGRIREILDSSSTTILPVITCYSFDLPALEYVLPEPELPVWERDSDFVAYSGKIRETWDNWYERFMIWEPVAVVQAKCMIFNKTFRRRFQGFNHGRHWDRKRR